MFDVPSWKDKRSYSDSAKLLFLVAKAISCKNSGKKRNKMKVKIGYRV